MSKMCRLQSLRRKEKKANAVKESKKNEFEALVIKVKEKISRGIYKQMTGKIFEHKKGSETERKEGGDPRSTQLYTDLPKNNASPTPSSRPNITSLLRNSPHEQLRIIGSQPQLNSAFSQ